MTLNLRISRDGLVECPECQRHIRAAEPLSSTICPFCDHALIDVEPAPELTPVERIRALIFAKNRAMAAALLGAAIAFAGCTDPVVVPLYGVPPPADAGFDAGTLDGSPLDSGDVDTGFTPLPPYGIGPVDAGT